MSGKSPDAIRTDCRYYRGDRPCFPGWICTPECERFGPVGKRVLLIKTAALGDVLRTTPLLRTLPDHLGPCQITWVTDSGALPLLNGLAEIDRALATTDPALPFLLDAETFDLAICLDKEPSACALLARANSRDKRGFTLAPHGAVIPANRSADYLWRLGLDDDEKFHRNERSYPELMHHAIGVPYGGERYILSVSEAAKENARDRLDACGLVAGERVVVGFQTGAGGVFANKAWTVTGVKEAIIATASDLGATPVLLGGPREAAQNRMLAEDTSHLGTIDAGADHDLETFAAIVGSMDIVVTGDTLAMHLGIAQGRYVVAIFGPTCAREIDLFGHGRKIVTALDCSPCYRRTCDISPSCMEKIEAAEVVTAIQDGIAGRTDDASSTPKDHDTGKRA